MKTTIDIDKIIESRGLDSNEVAHFLFPAHLHPVLALRRVAEGEGELDAAQIKRFAHWIGVEPGELFKTGWELDNIKGDLFLFKRDNYAVKYDIGTNILQIFDNGSLFHETIIISKAVTLTEFTAKLNQIIKKNESNKN